MDRIRKILVNMVDVWDDLVFLGVKNDLLIFELRLRRSFPLCCLLHWVFISLMECMSHLRIDSVFGVVRRLFVLVFVPVLWGIRFQTLKVSSQE